MLNYFTVSNSKVRQVGLFMYLRDSSCPQNMPVNNQKKTPEIA